MRILVAPQEFKGSLTARLAADAIAAGVRDALPLATVDVAPMSDGGPGLIDAMQAALGGERISTPVRDPLMREIQAAWLLLPDGEGVIEMAAASGLGLVSSAERNPLVTTTYGTGELVSAALDRGCRRITIGVGGSATIDAGAGALQALGGQLLDAGGGELPPGGAALARLDRIDLTGMDPRLEHTALRIATDVTSPLCGRGGAALMFGLQKGATPETARLLDEALERFARIARRDTGIELLTLRGGGAAGGLAAGLSLLPGAAIVSGFDLVARASSLERRVAEADAVITGEGRLDAQTAAGKVAAGVAGLARTYGKRVAIIAGSIEGDWDTGSGLFDIAEAIAPRDVPTEEAMRDAAGLLRAAARSVGSRISAAS